MTDSFDSISSVVYGAGSPYQGEPVSPSQAAYAGSAPPPQPNTAAGSAPTNPQYDTPGATAGPAAYHVDRGGQLHVPDSDPYAHISGLDPNSDPSMSPMEDMSRSFVTGAERGVTGMFGLPAAALHLVEGAADKTGQAISEFTGIPYSQDPDVANGTLFGAHVPDQSDYDKAFQAQLGPYHTPQSTPAKYSQAVGEFLPGLAAPGGPIAKAAAVLAPAVGSEIGGEVTAGTKLEPWARLVGALLGGGAIGGIKSVAEAPARLAGRAMADVTPAQVEMATQLRQGSPVPLTLGEAVQQVTGGSDGMGRLQHFWENSIPGGEQARPFFAQRPAAVQKAVSDFADTIAPPTSDPSMLGVKTQELGKALLNRSTTYRTQQVNPLYEAANPQTVPQEDMDGLLANISAQMAADKTGILARPLADLRDKLTDGPATAAAQAQAREAQATQAAIADQVVTINGQKVPLSSLPESVRAKVTGQPAPQPSPNDQALNIIRSGKPVQTGAGPSLLDFISQNGGLNDQGGEVSALDGDLWHRDQPFRPRIVKPDGVGLDEMAQRAHEAGYFPDVHADWNGADNTSPVGPQDLLDAMHGELAGDKRYAINDPEAQHMAGRVADMQELLDHLGLNPRVQSNADINQAIDEFHGVAPPPASALPSAAPAGPDPAGIRIPITDIENLDRTRKFVRDNTQAQIEHGRMTPEQGAVLNTHLDHLDAMMEAYSPEFWHGKQLFEDLSDRYVTPLQAGPIGKLARGGDNPQSGPDLGTQVRALYPPQPPEGTAAETSNAIRMMTADPSASAPFGGDYPIMDGTLAASLSRQHLVNTADTALADTQAGPNQWGGARLAKALAGSAEQRNVLASNLESLPNGPSTKALGDFLAPLQATGKRMATGSMTAFNQEMRDQLGAAPAPVRTLSTLLDPLEIGRHLDRAAGGAMYRRQLRGIGDLMLPAPGEEAAAFARAKAALPQNNQLLGKLLISGAGGQQAGGGQRSAP